MKRFFNVVLMLVFTCCTIPVWGAEAPPTVVSDLITKRPWVDARIRGAKGDGSTLDQTAVQNAINLVPEGGTLLIPSGFIFQVTSLSIPRAMTILGWGTLRQVSGSIGSNIITVNTDNVTVDGVAFSGPVTTGNSNFSDYAGIDIKDRSNIVIKNCTITGKQNGIQAIGTAATPVSNITIKDNTIRYTGKGIMIYPSNGTGVTAANFGTKLRITGNDVRLQAGYSTVYSGSTSSGEMIRGIAVYHFNDVRVEGNTSLGSIISCEVAQFVNDDFMTDIQVTNNTFDTWATVNGCDGGTVIGNIINYNLLPTIHAYSDYYGVSYGGGKVSNSGLELVYSKNLVVRGNIISNQPANGIFVGYAGTHPGSIPQTALNLLIDGNEIKGSALANSAVAGLQLGLIRDSVISNNLITGCGSGANGMAINAGGEVGISTDHNSPISNIQFKNNIVRNNLNTTSAVRIFGFKNVVVDGLISEGNAGNGLSIGESPSFVFTLINSKIRNNAKFALWYGINVREGLIEGNDFYGGNTDSAHSGVTTDNSGSTTALGTYVVLRNNKGIISDGTVPTIPITFAVGDIWPITHATNKWLRCTAQGTTGAIYTSGTIASITTSMGSSQATINARAAMELVPGQLINIAGVTGTKRVNSVVPVYAANGITLNVGATAYLSSAADASVTGAAITYAAPTIAQIL